MKRTQLSCERRDRERGVSLILVAILLAVLITTSALAVDLASLYVARNEAQRAADAAALAGAKVFVETTCAASANCSSYQTQARQRAIDVGGQNQVFGQAASIQAGDITFNGLTSTNPRITVVVQRSAARSNTVPMFFSKFFRTSSPDVSAAATAEAYVPSATGPGICVGCVKPLVFPDCDPSHVGPVNADCANQPVQYFVNPITKQVVNPGPIPTGVYGMSWAVHAQLVPSQYGIVDVGGGQSQLPQNFLSCSKVQYACGMTVPTLQGNQVGTVTKSVNTLINSGCPPNGCSTGGQDTINLTGPPFTITAGSNNPLVVKGLIAAGTTIDTSPSVVTLSLVKLSDITSGSGSYTVQGFMTVFIRDAVHNGNSDVVDVTIMSVSGCGTSSAACGAGGGVVGAGAPTPIRLVRNPGS